MIVADAALSSVENVVREAENRLAKALPNLDDMTIRTVTTDATLLVRAETD